MLSCAGWGAIHAVHRPLMLRPRLGSIRTQIQLLAALSAATALAVACAAFVLNDWRVASSIKRQQLYRYAAVVSRNVSPALQTGDWAAAESRLGAFRLEPTITAACLFDARGKVVATYRRDEVMPVDFPDPSPGGWIREKGDGQLKLFQPIHRQAERVGSLFVQSTQDDIQGYRAAYPLIVGVVFLISLGVSAAFAARMQSRISSPIEALSRAANLVTTDGDYSVRVHQQPSGQLGELCGAFNAMLARIETSDTNLQAARDELNVRVRERTRELHREVLERRYAESIASGQKRVLQQLATGKPLTEVLTALVSEIESHVRNTTAAISLVEPGAEWFGDPIGLRLSGHQREGLRQLPITGLGSAPARAAALVEPQQDRAHARGEGIDACGFDSTAHGGACWAAPVASADGRLLGVVTVFHRHDRQPNDEERELLESACSLGCLAIEQRNGEDALKAAMRKATAANRAKSDFLANMSHEIRTPLNAILGFADLLLGDSDGLDEQRRGYAETISSSGKHLLELINDILDLSKIEAAQLAVDLAPTDPNRVLAEVMSLLRVRAGEKGIALDCEWESPAPETISTDASRLRQLLVNLIGNAIKFTDEGGVRVAAAIEDHDSETPRLRVTITDTGIGIAEEKLAEIFNPFVQADASVTRRFGGTGLGLAICRRLSEAMGGELSVTSEVGQGSRFTLLLPTGSLDGVGMQAQPVCDGLQTNSPRDAGPKETDVPASLEGRRVLVVEDGETNRRLIGLVLRRAGVEVEMAVNGQEGYDAAMACAFDAILMDMQMPVMDGYTAARKLRDAGYEGLIIALTAHAMKGDEARCLESGCSDYLTKPIEAPRLLAKLAACQTGEAEGCEPVAVPPDEGIGFEPIASTLPTEDEDFREVAAMFIEKCSVEIEQMQRLADSGEWHELQVKAHWLKGSGGTAGYEPLSAAARALEAVLKDSPDDSAVTRCVEELVALQDRMVVRIDSRETTSVTNPV